MRRAFMPLLTASRILAGVLVAGVLGACTSDATPPVAPATGTTYAYVQTLLLRERRSGDEELPDVRIEQDVTVTAEAAGASGAPDRDGTAVRIAYGDARVWVGETTGEPAFRAKDAGARDRLYAAAQSELSAMYAALFAVMAHSTLEARVDGRGVLHDVVGSDEVRRRRDGDVASDVPGAMLESVLADPSFLFLARDADGRHPLRFELAHWNGAITLDSVIRDTGKSFLAIEREPSSGEGQDGPFGRLGVVLRGTATLGPGDGMLEGLDLLLEITADVAGGAGGARRDAALLTIGLSRTKR